MVSVLLCDAQDLRTSNEKLLTKPAFSLVAKSHFSLEFEQNLGLLKESDSNIQPTNLVDYKPDWFNFTLTTFQSWLESMTRNETRSRGSVSHYIVKRTVEFQEFDFFHEQFLGDFAEKFSLDSIMFLLSQEQSKQELKSFIKHFARIGIKTSVLVIGSFDGDGLKANLTLPKLVVPLGSIETFSNTYKMVRPQL